MLFLLYFVAFLASFMAIIIFFSGLIDEEPLEIFAGLILLTVAVAAWFGVVHLQNVEDTTWSGGDSVVYTVTTADDNTFLVTSDGTLLHCAVPAQCTPLVKGDHVTYQRLHDGKITLPDGSTRIADIKDVKKG